MTLGVFLQLTVRNRSAHRSLIGFTARSNLGHAAVMGYQALAGMVERANLSEWACLPSSAYCSSPWRQKSHTTPRKRRPVKPSHSQPRPHCADSHSRNAPASPPPTSSAPPVENSKPAGRILTINSFLATARDSPWPAHGPAVSAKRARRPPVLHRAGRSEPQERRGCSSRPGRLQVA
jgi:hypothetical protein